MGDYARPDGPVTSRKLRVFLSYSRRDSLEFTDQLANALKACGFDAIIDRQSIAGGEAWQQRLNALDCRIGHIRVCDVAGSRGIGDLPMGDQ